MTKIKAWFLAARPKTLTASVVPILASVGLVQFEGYVVNWYLVVCALLSSFSIQIGTNFVNDAMDFKKGADTSERLGPMRVTQQGFFTYNQVMMFAGLFFLAAIVFGVPLVISGGWPIMLIGLISVIMGYAYTSGPFPLAYRGLGDLFVIIFFGWVAVGGLYWLLTKTYTTSAFVVGLQIGLTSTVLIAINNLRDLVGDAAVNKKTLAVKLGKKGARLWIAILLISPFLVGYYWMFQNKMWIYIVPLASFPLALSIAKKIFRTEPSAEYNRFLAQASVNSLLFSILMYIGFQI